MTKYKVTSEIIDVVEAESYEEACSIAFKGKNKEMMHIIGIKEL